MFGRKKKQEEDEVVDEATSGQNNDLELAVGDDAQLNDDLSFTDSIPPPAPPIIDTKNEEDSRTVEEFPSTEPAIDAEESSLDVKDEAESIKRKKMILIATCFVSFCILLGLAIRYGKTRNQSKNRASTKSGLENSSFDSPLTDSETETGGESPTVETSPDDNVVEENTSQEIPNATGTTDVDGTDEETAILSDVEQGTSSPSEFTSSSFTSPGTLPEFEDCVANEISILSSCNENGIAAVTMNFCLVDELSDQFWEFLSTPPRIPPIIANDWGWIRDGSAADFTFLPEGDYEVGIFSSGDQQLNEYPLIASTQFVVGCGL